MAGVKKKKVLVAGGAGYIGSHTVVELLNTGKFDVVVADNLCNSSEESLRRVAKIVGQKVPFHKLDLATEPEKIKKLCEEEKFDSCIHFAGLKAVGESVKKPLMYYECNLVSTMNLLRALDAGGCRSIVFSSSATVYGDPQEIPIKETTPLSPATNPYGKTKCFIEHIISDFVKANEGWRAVLLRYFNPIGAHKSGTIGEDPKGIPNNLMPYICQVAVGKRPFLSVFGDDYDTVDGTGVRDYIHVVDLARGHVAAIQKDILNDKKSGTSVYNLGTGKGTSVLQLLKALEKASGKKLEYKIVARRDGDLATVYADCSFVAKELDWKAERSIEQACEDSWRWQSSNPNGFRPDEVKTDA